MVNNLLLVSNSILHGSGYLDHCEPQIRDVFEGKKRVLFVPYARPGGRTLDEYTRIARDRLQRIGFEVSGIHESDDPRGAVDEAEAIFIGGGNTFVLLKSLYDANIMDSIQNRVREGIPYLGTSAGSNVAGKTIMTTNDMPIVYPPSLDAMGLVPFIVNPHYQDTLNIPDDVRQRFNELLETDPGLAPLAILNFVLEHQGETREARIKEYHAFNDDVVVGLREGAMLHIVDDKVYLNGSTGARIFRKGQEPREHQPGESLDFLLSGNA